jgi:hypothetical protein
VLLISIFCRATAADLIVKISMALFFNSNLLRADR